MKRGLKMIFQKDIETLPRKEIEAIQLERLKWVVKYCYDNVPLYHQRLTDCGVLDGSKIKELSDIQYIPVPQASPPQAFTLRKTSISGLTVWLV